MEIEISEKSEEDMAPTDMEWEQRVLCSDGNCIGVIGPDGHCKECGKQDEDTLTGENFSENEDSSAVENAVENEEASAVENAVENEEPSPADMPQEAADSDDWQNRVLCSDGNCIGVIGPDRHCKECGKLYEG